MVCRFLDFIYLREALKPFTWFFAEIFHTKNSVAIFFGVNFPNLDEKSSQVSG